VEVVLVLADKRVTASVFFVQCHHLFTHFYFMRNPECRSHYMRVYEMIIRLVRFATTQAVVSCSASAWTAEDVGYRSALAASGTR